MTDDPPYRLDIEGVSPGEPPGGSPAGERLWLGIVFECGTQQRFPASRIQMMRNYHQVGQFLDRLVHRFRLHAERDVFLVDEVDQPVAVAPDLAAL